VIVTGFGEICNLVRESKMFVKDEVKVLIIIIIIIYTFV